VGSIRALPWVLTWWPELVAVLQLEGVVAHQYPCLGTRIGKSGFRLDHLALQEGGLVWS